MEAYRKAFVYVREDFAGTLMETDYGYSFAYDEEYLRSDNAAAVSLTLPLQSEEFRSKTLFSFFDGLIPEGWLLDIVIKNWKLSYKDRFGLLLAACKDPIGCVSIRSGLDTVPQENEPAAPSEAPAQSVAFIGLTSCLCCGKPLADTKSQAGWHDRCIKKFFGTSSMPYIDISEEVLDRLAQDSTDRGLTVPGVQKKLSLHLTEGKEPRLTLVNYPTGYILKPQTEEYPALPEMEYLVMRMAQATKISTVPFALVKSAQNTFAYITKRIDRVRTKNNEGRRMNASVHSAPDVCFHRQRVGDFAAQKQQTNAVSMLAMEDFCQLDGRLTEDKYRGSYERCGKLVTGYSAASGADLAELFLRVVFSFAVGNSDMHLKNFSLIEGKESSGEFTLSAAYDMLSANVVLPSDKEQLALTLNGKKQNIRRKDFLIFAETIGLPTVSAERLIQRVVAMREEYLSMCENSYLPEDMKQKLMQLIGERMAVLEKRRAEG